MIAVIDSGLGNVQSVLHAFRSVGVEATLTTDPDAIVRADRIVFPGVGAFPACMSRLADGLGEALREAVQKRARPLLGICLGMQVLTEEGDEVELTKGLGWIPGRTRKLRAEESGLRLPHIGWNTVAARREHPVFAGIDETANFYFVHSYVVEPASADAAVLTCTYGETFAAALAKDNIVATQFHPEKSQRHGFALLERFAAWSP